MAIRAYDEDYLPYAQWILGDMLDFAVNTYEIGITHFVEEMNSQWSQYYTDTNLKRLRKTAGLSQRELSELSEVSLRQIQLFEQKKRDINHCHSIDLFDGVKFLPARWKTCWRYRRTKNCLYYERFTVCGMAE